MGGGFPGLDPVIAQSVVRDPRTIGDHVARFAEPWMAVAFAVAQATAVIRMVMGAGVAPSRPGESRRVERSIETAWIVLYAMVEADLVRSRPRWLDQLGGSLEEISDNGTAITIALRLGEERLGQCAALGLTRVWPPEVGDEVTPAAELIRRVKTVVSEAAAASGIEGTIFSSTTRGW
jgi:hypothetical protein